MSQKARDAFDTAKQIELLYTELLEQLSELGADEELSTQQRHLAIKQICDVASSNNGIIEGYAKDYLETKVERCSKMNVEGIDLGGRYVAGMVYSVRPNHKIEILNKDDESWGKLIKALVDAGYAKAIQKRLTASHFVGAAGEKALAAAAGLVECSTEESWSITKPKG